MKVLDNGQYNIVPEHDLLCTKKKILKENVTLMLDGINHFYQGNTDGLEAIVLL